MSTASDAVRMAVGTLTAVPVGAPRRVDRRVAGAAMLLGPLAVVPLGAAVAGIGVAGHTVGLPGAVVALLAVAALALGTRILHWDGLSDVADGLTVSYDRDRSLEVMRSGTAGPAGVVAVTVVLALQVAGLVPLLATWEGSLVAGVAVCVARCGLATSCVALVPSARPGGLGATVAGTVPVPAALLVWLAGAAALTATAGVHGLLAAAVAAVVVVALLRRTVRRFGGMTGDVLGAGVELAFAALVVVLAARGWG